MKTTTWVLFSCLLLAASILGAEDKSGPKAGQVWLFTYNRYIAGDIIFRDVSGKKWPNFFWGPREGKIGGAFTSDPVSPKMSCFFVADRCCQTKGDPSLKILGEWITPEEWPLLTFTVRQLGGLAESTGQDAKATKAWTIDAILDVDGKQFPLKGKVAFSFWTTTGRYEAKFLVKGSDLGLKAEGCTGDIEITVHSNFRDQEYEKGPDGHTRVKNQTPGTGQK